MILFFSMDECMRDGEGVDAGEGGSMADGTG